MNSDCERLQGFPDGWTLIGEPEEIEINDYLKEWVPGEDCKYKSVSEAELDWENTQEWVDLTGNGLFVTVSGEEFDPKEYGFVEKKTKIGSHKTIGFFYTDRDGKKHRCSEANRYRALGNSIAVGYANNQSGFWMTLMKRISAQYERSATLGSLFCGIGGFDLAWATYNGAKNCRWSSEIEPYCIEVMRQHFGDEERGEVGDIGKYL